MPNYIYSFYPKLFLISLDNEEHHTPEYKLTILYVHDEERSVGPVFSPFKSFDKWTKTGDLLDN